MVSDEPVKMYSERRLASKAHVHSEQKLAPTDQVHSERRLLIGLTTAARIV
jgi:hypothetical protein